MSFLDPSPGIFAPGTPVKLKHAPGPVMTVRSVLPVISAHNDDPSVARQRYVLEWHEGRILRTINLAHEDLEPAPPDSPPPSSPE